MPAKPEFFLIPAAAEYLTGRGCPISARELSKLCCPSNGKGPKVSYRFRGRRLLHVDDLDAWGDSMKTPAYPDKPANVVNLEKAR
jgi:hypothetical protein